MTAAYDAGALIAAERGDREMWAEHRRRLQAGRQPITTAPVVAQVSRSGQQARLRMFLGGCAIVPFAADQAHAVGRLIGRARTADVVDGHLVLVAGAREIFTSDPDDLRALADGVHPRPVVRVV